MIGPFLEWLETGAPQTVTDARAMLGEALEWALASGVLEHRGAATAVICPKCLHGESVRVRRYGTAWKAYCLNGGGSFSPEDDDIALVVPVRKAWARKVSALLQDKPPRELADESVWEVGHVEVAGVSRAIFLACGVVRPETAAAVAAAIDGRGSQWRGAILATGVTPSTIRTRGGHRYVPAENVLTLSGNGLTFDTDGLQRWLRGEPTTRRQPSRKTSQKQKWTEPARQIWDDLHASGKLSENVSEGMRLVGTALEQLKPPLEFVPGTKVLRAELGTRHRAAYPLKIRR